MKYYKRLGVYKNSTGSNYYDPEKQEAFSYRWWRYLQNIEGKLVFNNYSYSVTTSGHQSTLRSLLDYPSDMIYVRVSEGLNGIGSIHTYIKTLENECEALRKDILRPRTRKSTNKNRVWEMKNKLKEIKKLVDTFNLVGYNELIDNLTVSTDELGLKVYGKLHITMYGVA